MLSLALSASSAYAAFTDVTVPYGIASGDSMSYGASFIDFDGDGDQDLYVNNHWKNAAQFFRNDGSLPWVEHSAHLGVGNADRHDVLWGDFNNDGSPDQYIVHGAGQDNELFWNRGGGVLEEGAVAAGVADTDGRAREATLADFNSDGWLDIFVVNDFRNGFKRPNVLFMNNGNGTFFRFPNIGSIFASRLHVSSVDYDLDGDPDLLTTNPPWAPGEIWRNDGLAVFNNVTSGAFPGISAPLGQANGLSWADYDNDGDPDLLACGGNRAMWDYAGMEGDSLRWYAELQPGEDKRVEFVTQGDSVTVFAGASDYAVVTLTSGAAANTTTTLPVTLAVADIAGEPPPLAAAASGLYVWSTSAAPGDSIHLAIFRAPTETADLLLGGSIRANGTGVEAWQNVGFAVRPSFSLGNFRNRLYRNEGDGTFTEVTATAFAVNDSTVSSLGAAWGDYDNDGWLDVYITNSGNVETGNLPNELHRNNGDGTFTEVAALEGVAGSDRGLGDGAAWADVNGDGFLDLFTDNGAEHPVFGVGPRQLFENSPNANHWMQLDVRGLVANGSGIGTRIRFVSASGEQWRTVQGESDNCFSNSRTIHVGFGVDDLCDSLQVFWPSGTVSNYTHVAVDEKFWLIEGKPLRLNQNPHFIALLPSLSGTIAEGEAKNWDLAVDNFGGQPSVFNARYEDCSGAPISWLSVSPESGGLWPSEVGPFVVTADASGLMAGAHCGRIVFESNSFLGPDTVTVNITVTDSSVGVDLATFGFPGVLSLGSPHPNPTSGRSRVTLGLPQEGRVEAAVYDITGRRVAVLESGVRSAGWHTLEWSGRGQGGRPVAAGVYLVRAQAAGETVVRKIVVRD